MSQKTVAMLGAGSWGTAVAIHLAQVGHRVLLWGHNPKHMDQMAKDRLNATYLPSAPFPKNLHAISDLKQALQADYIIIAVPSHAFSELLNQINHPVKGLAWLTKGLDPKTHLLLSTIVAEKFGVALPVAVLSGPSFAKEVARFLPTALTLAGNNLGFEQEIHQLMHHKNMRVYKSDDLIGVQLCGAVKNVLAIACGISDGLGYGANAKAALITRGLAEMSRLGLSLGAQAETFAGLAGVGDLVLTCTDNQSRNRGFGLLVGQGLGIKEAQEHIGQVVEGMHNASQVCALAQQNQIDMPICQQIHALLHHKIQPQEAVEALMKRPARGE